MSETGTEDQFWFCLKHHTVEPREGCRAKDRLGPYATAAEAARALEKVAERNEEWEEADQEWDATGSSGPPPGDGQS